MTDSPCRSAYYMQRNTSGQWFEQHIEIAGGEQMAAALATVPPAPTSFPATFLRRVGKKSALATRRDGNLIAQMTNGAMKIAPFGSDFSARKGFFYSFNVQHNPRAKR